MEWKHDDTVYLHGECKDSNKFSKYACFDLDDTLITTKSGKKFPEDGDDWKFLYKEVPNKIKKLYDDKYNIVIITNQAGLNKKTDGTEWWKNKIENIVKELDIPITIYASLVHSHYRKPYPTFWKMLIGDKTVNITKSFYCGDACGRKNDFSDTDLKFASNCGLQFMLPEHLFNKAENKYPAITYPVNFEDIPTGADYKFVPSNNEMIIMVGMPGSGKSTFVQKYIVQNNYCVINRDTFGTMKKCITECTYKMHEHKSIVIDNTNPSIDARKSFIDLAKRFNYTCRCIIIDTEIGVAKHNACYRNYVSNGEIGHIPDIVYNIYKKKYEPPTNGEGFTKIETVKFSLDKNVDMEKYKLYYIGNTKRGY